MSKPAAAPVHSSSYSRDVYPAVFRCVAFVDVAGFTAHTDQHGIHAAARMLEAFRHIVRIYTGMHGARVAKWLGDGVMIVGVEEEMVLDCLRDIFQHCRDKDIRIHAGISSGDVLIFEGDDYVGAIVNTAARLADKASAGELFAYGLRTPLHGYAAPIELEIKGIGLLSDIQRVMLNS